MSVELPFALGATAYISSPYFCDDDKALPCTIINYHINQYGTTATCFVEGYNLIPCSADHLYATEAEAIEKRGERTS